MMTMTIMMENLNSFDAGRPFAIVEYCQLAKCLPHTQPDDDDDDNDDDDDDNNDDDEFYIDDVVDDDDDDNVDDKMMMMMMMMMIVMIPPSKHLAVLDDIIFSLSGHIQVRPTFA